MRCKVAFTWTQICLTQSLKFESKANFVMISFEFFGVCGKGNRCCISWWKNIWKNCFIFLSCQWSSTISLTLLHSTESFKTIRDLYFFRAVCYRKKKYLRFLNVIQDLCLWGSIALFFTTAARIKQVRPREKLKILLSSYKMLKRSELRMNKTPHRSRGPIMLFLSGIGSSITNSNSKYQSG